MGSLFERAELAKKLKAKLRPALIAQVLEKRLDEDEAREFIEGWVDEALDAS
ncbi:MAG TPA: hypothetical protein VGS20_16475 [Candidatus Acidoferrales bacterium]|nr:hypothetical protein [Candidatus Acidoferrales bacterium]